ncbi:uncharacterized protein LOC127264860 [Andrographis paniculata]|uniref:uncharacterized protein LOC127264860 n=1 Tax=Andrographis paniculata TaxID=175694 RepID=UPI0021E75FBB|nr:uncharacterized protein LOC127264860 [Andrographis paniculata]
MESENRGIRREISTHIRRDYVHSTFTEPPLRSGYLGPEFGRAQLAHSLNYDYQQQSRCYPPLHPFPSHRPHYIQDAVQTEIAMEQMRSQIIMTELMRSRALMAEVMRERELLMERELILRHQSDGFVFGSTPKMGYDSLTRLPLLGARAEPWPLENGTVQPFAQIIRPNGRVESGGCEGLISQAGTPSLRISEVNASSESNKEKPIITLQVKRDENITGSKRKLKETPDSAKSPSDNHPTTKKAKTEWSCSICQIQTTGEQGLIDHLKGKKHKSKEAAMKVQASGKNYRIGFCATKPAKPTVDQPPTNCSDKPKLLEGRNHNDNKKNDERVTRNAPKYSGAPKKDNFKFWCEKCRVGAYSKEVFENHKKGKRHVGLARANKENPRHGAGGDRDGKFKACGYFVAQKNQASGKMS